MPKYQLLTCRIALSGDVGNVVVRSASRPITYPELIVLSVLHGESSISSIEDCGETEERNRDEEFLRLGHIYDEKLVKTLFPGHAINLPERNDRYPRSKLPAPVSPPASQPSVDTVSPQDEIDPLIAAQNQSAKRVPART